MGQLQLDGERWLPREQQRRTAATTGPADPAHGSVHVRKCTNFKLKEVTERQTREHGIYRRFRADTAFRSTLPVVLSLLDYQGFILWSISRLGIVDAM